MLKSIIGVNAPDDDADADADVCSAVHHVLLYPNSNISTDGIANGSGR